VYAAAVEDLDADERIDFDAALQPRPRVVSRPVPRALPPAAAPVLRAVPDPDPQRFSADRLAAIRALGGAVTTGEGA